MTICTLLAVLVLTVPDVVCSAECYVGRRGQERKYYMSTFSGGGLVRKKFLRCALHLTVHFLQEVKDAVMKLVVPSYSTVKDSEWTTPEVVPTATSITNATQTYKSCTVSHSLHRVAYPPRGHVV